MFHRFIKFYESSPYSLRPLHLDAYLIHEWVEDLMRRKVGKSTPRSALGCMTHLSEVLEFDYYGNHHLLHGKVRDYEEGKFTPSEETEPFDVRFLSWLEDSVIGRIETHTTPDRLLCARVRMLIQSSTRHNDQKRSPLS